VIEIDTARLRGLAEKATPGEWITVKDEKANQWRVTEPKRRGLIGIYHTEPDAAYLAALSPDVVLALLDRSDRLAEIERLMP